MRGAVSLKVGLGVPLVAVGVACMAWGLASCGTAPTPFVVQGPGQFGNDPPTLTILEPNSDITRGQGDPFLIRWTDTDRDDNAQISYFLLSTTSNRRIMLVEGVDENDTIGPDSFTVSTTLIPPDSYNVLGTIDDGVNPLVEQFAVAAGAALQQRVVVTLVGPGEGPQTVPPIITVTEPTFNLSVAQDDVLTVAVQPTPLPPDPNNPIPYDPDSNVTLYILLDLDLDPNNDDPANPGNSDIIVLRETLVQTGDVEAITFEIRIDLAVVPPRPAGEPYYIRATVDDGTNPRVHQYAVGTINVVRLAAGTVDLFDIGRTRSGARFYGFNPGANLGSSVAHISDFDADGVDDFILVAQFGNPQNVGPVGEAYLVYGRDEIRFGGAISANSVSGTISGVVFQAPPVRTSLEVAPDPSARTDGIVHVTFIQDLTGDGRPDLLFGLPHVHGAYDSTDYDPGDDYNVTTVGCYPDYLVNNSSDQEPDRDLGWYAGGMAVIVNSQNRDNDGLVNINRLESTTVALELVGHPLLEGNTLDAGGLSNDGSIIVRADNDATEDRGNDPQEEGRIAGARFIAGGFNYLRPDREPPREGLFGQTIAPLGDLNSNGLAEIIISAPRNERYIADLETSGIPLSPHLNSTVFTGSIIVLPGTNYNDPDWRDDNNDLGACVIPYLDHHEFAPFGSCSSTPPTPRHYVYPAGVFQIFAEDVDDMLGGGRSAGDFNQDGVDDILCGAPLNDRGSSLSDTGAVYVIYGRTFFGEVQLSRADDPQRPPMLRVRGSKIGDQIGWRVTAGMDVNGDRISDVFVSSPRSDFGDLTRSACGSDIDQDGSIDQNDFVLRTFNNCEMSSGDHVYTDEACKAFDYDNDEDIDEDDRCVFCCLSDDCEPDDNCVFGTDSGDCCANLVDNGFIGIIFGGVYINGDRDIGQLATSELPGTIFFGSESGHRAGSDISSAGDFNQDGFGDILITVPGEVRQDSAGRDRLGVVYLIFGGTHLANTTWNLSDVGSQELPGIVFLSPYVKGRPNEAAPTTAAYIGDINGDGFGDIAIGNPKADFIDPSFPQGPDAPGSDPATGRRSDVGDAYVIYGNNFGSNRALP